MAGTWTTVSVKDAGGTMRTMRAWDESGTGAGPFSFGTMLAVGDGSHAASFGSGLTDAGTQRVAIATDSVNPNGEALVTNSAPVTQAPTSFRVAVTPTVTASAYTAGNVLGGIMTFANVLLGAPTASPTKWSAVLESISVKFKATAATGEIDVAIFTASPSGGTYTDKTAPTFAAADAAKLVGIYALPTPQSTLGTMTCYNLDGIGATIDGASTSLFAVVTVKG